MTRVLFAWELGANLGHLARAVPIMQRLRAEGCETICAACDVEGAHSLLTPVEIEFVAAPRYRGPSRSARSPINYSDLLGQCGYLDPPALRALLRAWINLLRAVAPDAVVIDHAPTALLATKVLAIPGVLIGTGFTVPPAMDPMPALLDGVTGAELAAVDAKVLNCINNALRDVGSPALTRVAQLFAGAPAMITTFRELDHYRGREHGAFVGPVWPPQHLPSVSWRDGRAARILVYLNADFPRLAELLSALVQIDATVLCVVPGAGADIVRRFGGDRLTIFDKPVNVGSLLQQATLVVTHCGSGLTAQALIAGVSLLAIPRFLEQEMYAKRVAESGAALVVGAQRSQTDFTRALARMLDEPSFARSCPSAGEQVSDFDAQRAVDTIAETVVQLARRQSAAVSA